MICNYMDKCKTVEKLDLLDNDITPLGCEFLGKILSVSSQLPLIELRLDHNVFGTEGLQNLAFGLRMNPTLEKLSLKYCGIDENGAVYLQQILAYINSKLLKLKLQGNVLKNKGIYDLFSGLEVNDSLQRINISDNQFGEDPKVNVIEQICKVMRTNTTLGAYNFRYNGIYDEAARKFLEVVKEYKHIFRMKLTEHLSKEVAEGFKNCMKKRKAPKKKKKKGKKGKKGKK
eukprot:TRINITY_DN7344_c0_g1_i1.p1 TRINITY_DN7344_c0_g1~~TRINITY_DN7344_c0_g1_i1.p1  ORF type:complete len:230 (-),score=47.93 TRINITY_DN7344_c0_g1_i1:114-803(-)